MIYNIPSFYQLGRELGVISVISLVAYIFSNVAPRLRKKPVFETGIFVIPNYKLYRLLLTLSAVNMIGLSFSYKGVKKLIYWYKQYELKAVLNREYKVNPVDFVRAHNKEDIALAIDISKKDAFCLKHSLNNCFKFYLKKKKRIGFLSKKLNVLKNSCKFYKIFSFAEGVAVVSLIAMVISVVLWL